MSGALAIGPADPLGAEALALLHLAVLEARARYPEFFDPAAPPPTNEPLGERCAFVLARIDGVAVGCGALRPLRDPADPGVAEVRRMFVRAGHRRRGVARGILAALEDAARRFGYREMVIETGNRQPEAIALYDDYADERIAPYGSHAGDPTSVCWVKRLLARGASSRLWQAA